MFQIFTLSCFFVSVHPMLYLVTPYHVKLKEIQENYLNHKVEHGKSFAFALVIYDPILRVL